MMIIVETQMTFEQVQAHKDKVVLSLCEKIGFGFVMDSASRQWHARDPVGAFMVGTCFGLKDDVTDKEVEAAQGVFEKWLEDLGLDISSKESAHFVKKMLEAAKKVT